MPTDGGVAESDPRGVESAKVVARSRFNPALLNALSSFTVDPTPSLRTDAAALCSCVGPESGLADGTADDDCDARAAIWARAAPQPRTVATRATAATVANTDRCGNHRDGILSPKLTVPHRLPVVRRRQPSLATSRALSSVRQGSLRSSMPLSPTERFALSSWCNSGDAAASLRGSC